MLTENFMDQALKEAKLALDKKEIPVGAVIVYNKKVIVSAHNKTEEMQNITAHAEMIAIDNATKILKKKFLVGCEIYVTLEPCAMCIEAILLARFSRLYFGTYNTSFYKKPECALQIYGGFKEKQCKSILNFFFSATKKKYLILILIL